MASAKAKYVFSTLHKNIELNAALWQLKKDRSSEWEEIVTTLQKSPEEFELLMADPDVQATVPAKEEGYAPRTFMNLCGSLNLSFGWLLQAALNALPFSCNFVTLLRDLQDNYCALKTSPIPDDERQICQPLGASFDLEIKAQGVPTPAFHWMKLPDANDGEDWLATGVTTPRLRIENFQLSDVGVYQCYVSHRVAVETPDGSPVKGLYTAAFEVSVEQGSLLITEHPKDVQTVIGGAASFACSAESELPLTYQWFHDQQLLLGQTDRKLPLTQLWLDSQGEYSCRVSNTLQSATSRGAHLRVEVPSERQIANAEVSFSHTDIRIVQQPLYASEKRAAIGDKIVLNCLAVCHHPLKYEWLKQGVRKDLTSTRRDEYTPVTPVALGAQLSDEIEEMSPPVSAWTYQCSVTCPKTGERVKSRPVTVDVSTFTTPEKSLPTFKVALVICQEVYSSHTYFHRLRAPKNDGTALIAALKELDFQVLAFTNLTLQEVRHAIDLFAAFIDGSTYALFYYNGHALGYGNDVYLVARDTNFDAGLPLNETLLWHGEVETKLDRCNPLSFTIIYDSCRDTPPDVIADMVRSARHEPFSLSSNFCIGYGTRPSMRSFEKLDGKSGSSQGVHITV